MSTDKTNKIIYDIDDNGKFCNGEIIFENGKITKTKDGEFVAEYTLDDIEKVEQLTDVGCGRLELRRKNSGKENNISLCRFSIAEVESAAEFMKVVNFYLVTGKVTELHVEVSKCPVCGRRFLKGTHECVFCVKKTTLFSRAVNMFKQFIPDIIKIGILLIFSTAMTIVTPLIQGRLIDTYLTPNGSYSSAEKGISFAIFILVLLYAAGILLNVFSSLLSAKTGSYFSNAIRLKLYDKIQMMSVSAVSKHTAGSLIKRITKDSDGIMDFFVVDGARLLKELVMMIIVLVILLVTNAKLALLVLLPIPLIYIAFQKAYTKMRRLNRLMWKAGSRETSVLHDIIRGIRVVKTFGNEEKEIEKFSAASKRFADLSVVCGRFWSLFIEPITFIVGIGEFLVLLIGGKMVLDGKLTLGQLVQFNLYLAYLYAPLKWMSGLPRRVSQATTSLVRVFDILDEKIDVDNAEETIPATTDGDIKFENVTFGYKSYEPVLKNVDLTIKKGEMMGLVGHSGAGKSTLINLIIRLFDPDSGKITIDGNDLKYFNQQEYRDKIGVVFQETFLFAGTIYDNIVYSKPDATYEEVISASKDANAHEFIMRLPDGYNTIIGENGHRLSGGERQRLAIARAILRDPEILILDEATSALDPETEEEIQQALSNLVKGRTTVAIAHRLSTLRHADRLAVIENGQIAELGSHVELLNQRGIYYNLVMAQRQMTQRE